MRTQNGEMSERQAARIIEMFENASRNGEEWAHDVFLHRGTEKYEESLIKLNEAFAIRSIQTVVKPLKLVQKASKPQVRVPKR
jgi:hypothetical protein